MRFNTEILFTYHDAKKAGKHYDLRIKKKQKNKWASWRLIYPAPKELVIPINRHPIKAVSTHVHSDKAAKFEGTIEDGQYGAGKLHTYFHGKILIEKTDGFRSYVVFTFLDGKFRNQRCVLYRISGKQVWVFFQVTKRKAKK